MGLFVCLLTMAALIVPSVNAIYYSYAPTSSLSHIQISFTTTAPLTLITNTEQYTGATFRFIDAQSKDIKIWIYPDDVEPRNITQWDNSFMSQFIGYDVSNHQYYYQQLGSNLRNQRARAARGTGLIQLGFNYGARSIGDVWIISQSVGRFNEVIETLQISRT